MATNLPLPAARDADEALAELLAWLEPLGYDFVPPTPATHANRLARAILPPAEELAEILGWSRWFDPTRASPALLRLLAEADMLEEGPQGARSRVRVARLEGCLFLHSAYPTTAEDSVFLGPDSYRFARLIGTHFTEAAAGRCVDIGTGAGVGAVVAARLLPEAELWGTDINPLALRLARINAAHAGVAVSFAEGPGLSAVTGQFDLVMANPPFMIDPDGRLYRDGGGDHGLERAHGLIEAAVPRLAPGGRILMFTGSPMVEGADPFRRALEERVPAMGCTLHYEELDPDVYGEELAYPHYAHVDRIALVSAIIRRAD